MKKLLLFLILITIFSCQENKKDQSINTEYKETNEIISDTIIKRAVPSKLDLTRNQFYIDTTEYSTSKRNLDDWNSTTKKEIESNIENFQLNSLDSVIPKKWITIRKYNDEFFNYDRCDGKDPRIEIIGNALIYNGIHEKTIYHLDEITKIKSGWKLKSSSNPIKEFSFENTDIRDIFIYKFNGLNGTFKSYVTPFENIKNFDHFVNHCANEKVDEFSKFQDPE